MTQKRHTVDQITAHLREADLQTCNASTHFTDCNFDVDWGEGTVNFPSESTNQPLLKKANYFKYFSVPRTPINLLQRQAKSKRFIFW